MKRILLVASCLSLCATQSVRAAAVSRGTARVVVSKGLGAEACLSENALRRAVDARLQRSAFRGDAPVTLEVGIVLQGGPTGWTAELTTRDGAGRLLGRRSIVTEAAHCSALDDSLALVVALLVDTPPTVPTTPQPDTEVEAPLQLTTLSLPRTTLAPREPWRFDVGLSAVANVGTVPGLAPGAEVGMGAQAPHMPALRLFADWFAEGEQQRAASSAGAHFQLAQVGLELCAWDVRLGPLRWFGCGGQTLGRLKVNSYGFDQNTSSEHLTFALSARSGLRFPVAGRVAGQLGVRGELPLSRAVFDYGSRDGSQQALYEMSPVTAALDLGLIVKL